MLPRVSPPTPSRRNPVAFGLKPRESVPHLGPQGQISYFNRIERKVRGSTVRAPDLGPTSGKCQCDSRVSPPTPTRCNPVAFGLKPRESVPHFGPQGQISYFNRIERKVRGSTVRAPDLGPTSGKCQCASRVSPPTPTRCNPVAFGLKPRESVPHFGPQGQISYFNLVERKVRGSTVRAPDLGPTSRKCQCAPQGVPSNTY